MSNFSAVLQEYQLGICGLEQVETQIEEELIHRLVPAEELIGRLEQQHTIRAFAPDERASIERCIWTIETRRRTELGIVGAAESDRSGPVSRLPGGTAAVSDEDDQATRLQGSSEAIGPGTVLKERYRLDSLIGRGGMSEVYRAVDQTKVEFDSRDPHVAVKIMKVSTRNMRDAVIAMQREVQKSQKLTHENILRVHEFDRDGDIAFMTMELLNGESLLQRLSRSTRGGLTVEEADGIVRQMSDALEYAHQKGIVHADFKPGNVFIDAQNRVKVIDFGIARAVSKPEDPEGDKTVFDPRVLGAMTPAYASPEMLEGEEPDPRDDVYSLGCVAYELYTGRHPFARARATDARDADYQLTRPAQIPKRQWAAISKALEFDRDRRISSARLFREAFTAPAKSIAPVAIGAVVGVFVVAAGVYVALGGRDSAPSPGPAPICSDCPRLVTIPSGSALIGSPVSAQALAFEQPEHRIFIGAPLEMAATEVTVGQFRAFVEATDTQIGGCRSVESGWEIDAGLSWRNPGFAQTDDHPVTCVSYRDAKAYVAWLSERAGTVYRLPSEAEWEFAARHTIAGSEAESCGYRNTADRSLLAVFPGLDAADCSDGYAFTSPVGVLDGPSGGLRDVQGNVFEWTEDCWNPDYANPPKDGSANLSGDCAQRILRGGSWFTAPGEVRLAYRNRAPADYRSNTFGFRLMKDSDDE